MKVQGPVRAEEKRASGLRRWTVWFAVGVLGIAVGVFFGKFYFVREFLLFVATTAILAVFGANLAVLVIVLHAAWRSILQSVQSAKPGTVADEKAKAERQARAFVGSPTVSPMGRPDSL